MAWSKETVVQNFSGTSAETKPKRCAGDTVPNGSRWREVDTGKIFHYDGDTDSWYESEHNIKAISGENPSVDLRSIDLQEQILETLKKIEYHLYLATDTELKDQDV